MTRLKLYILASMVWFIGLFNMERLIAPINLASFVYVLAAAYALIILTVSQINRLSLLWLVPAGLVPYFGLKVALAYPILGASLPLTITEIVSLVITIYLARQIGHHVDSLRTEILRLTVGSASVAARPFRTAQADCYREIRRARHYNRPAAVLSVSPSKESIDLSINRFMREAQNSIIRQYIVARTADLLRKELKETDVVTMRNNHFLVLLPETEGRHLDTIITRLQSKANERLGLTLNVGASTFPDEAITFESLVEHAEKKMKESPAPQRTSNEQPAVEKANGHVNPELNQADVVR